MRQNAFIQSERIVKHFTLVALVTIFKTFLRSFIRVSTIIMYLTSNSPARMQLGASL